MARTPKCPEPARHCVRVVVPARTRGIDSSYWEVVSYCLQTRRTHLFDKSSTPSNTYADLGANKSIDGEHQHVIL